MKQESQDIVLRKLAPFRAESIDKRRKVLLRNYAERAVVGARQRAKAHDLPCNIDADFIEQLMVANNWNCAVSGIALVPRKPNEKKGPFSPSLDRIIPNLGYTKENVRVVCHIVNCAMNEWGLETLMQLVKAFNKLITR